MFLRVMIGVREFYSFFMKFHETIKYLPKIKFHVKLHFLISLGSLMLAITYPSQVTISIETLLASGLDCNLIPKEPNYGRDLFIQYV